MGSAKAFRAITAPSLLASALRLLPDSCTTLSEATVEGAAVQSGIALKNSVICAGFAAHFSTCKRFAAGRLPSFPLVGSYVCANA